MRCLAFGLLIIALVKPAASQDTSASSFFEDFDSFSTDFWSVSDGWTNGTWQNCIWSRDNVSISDGILNLIITETPNASGFSCGEIQTRDRYGHGTYEVRMRTGQGSGINAAFFTYIGEIHGAHHDEIDIEILTRDTSQVSMNTYVAGEPHGGGRATVPGGTQETFVTYGFEWTPERIRWFVNGEPVHETSDQLPTEAQKIWLSIWSTETLTDWMGPFDTSALPARLEVDWVSFTALGEGCRFTQSLTCEKLDRVKNRDP